jgi:hypothetical protein
VSMRESPRKPKIKQSTMALSASIFFYGTYPDINNPLLLILFQSYPVEIQNPCIPSFAVSPPPSLCSLPVGRACRAAPWADQLLLPTHAATNGRSIFSIDKPQIQTRTAAPVESRLRRAGSGHSRRRCSRWSSQLYSSRFRCSGSACNEIVHIFLWYVP